MKSAGRNIPGQKLGVAEKAGEDCYDVGASSGREKDRSTFALYL